MMKALILTLAVIVLFGCTEEDPQCRVGEMRYVPTGAKLIKNYEDMWMEWELDGNCFLSYNVKGNTGLLAQVKCKEKL